MPQWKISGHFSTDPRSTWSIKGPGTSGEDGRDAGKYFFCNGNKILGILGQNAVLVGGDDDPVADDLVFQGQRKGVGLRIGGKKGRKSCLRAEKCPVIIGKQGNEELCGLGFQKDLRLDPGGQEALVDGFPKLHGGMGEEEGKAGKGAQICPPLRAVFQDAPGVRIIFFWLLKLCGGCHILWFVASTLNCL